MTPNQAFDEMLTRIEALDKSNIRPPEYKVENRVVEAQRLFKVASKKSATFERLASVDIFDMFNLLSLDTMALAVKFAESEWTIINTPERTDIFKEKVARAVEVRADLLRDMSYVDTRFSPQDLAHALGKIREGNTRQDTLQDLSTLDSLARKYQNELGKIGFDMALADEAASLSSELGRVLNVDKSDMVQAKATRDRCSTLLEKMMYEVRSAAKYLFRHDAELLSEFTDHAR